MFGVLAWEAERGSNMLYDPDPCKRGYVYLMRKDERRTMKVLLKLKNVMIGKMIFNAPDYRD